MELNDALEDEHLQVQVPSATKQALERKAVENREPMRMVVLRALAHYGIDVPQDAIRDRRRTRS